MKSLFALVAFAGLSVADAAIAEKASLQNQSLRVEIDAKGQLAGMVDLASARNFVAAAAEQQPLYVITLADAQHGRTRVTSGEAGQVTPKLAVDRQSLELTFTHDKPRLVVRVRVRLPAEGSLSYWRLDVENQSRLAVIQVDFPGFALPQVLGSDPDDTCVIFPHANNSQRFWNLPEEFKYVWNNAGQRGPKSAQPIRWPLRLCANYAPDVVQMMACYDRTAGLYLATYDDRGHAKEYAVQGLDPRTMRLAVGHIRPWQFGKDFVMEYETVVGVFHGDWTTAAAIYRDWAAQQRWCAGGKLTRKDTPDWIKRYPVHLRFLLNHPLHVQQRRDLTPWDQLIERLEQFKRDYPALYPDAMVNLIDHDPGGFWSGFYNERWPAWMGNDNFAKLVRDIKARGLHPSMEPFGWHVSFTDPDRPDFDVRRKPYWDDLLQTKLVWSEKDVAQPGGPSGQPAICAGTDYGQSVFGDDAKLTAPWGMDLLQLMEIRLVSRHDCFNPRHGHPPGRGQWVYEAAYEAARKTREAGRAANPDFGTDKEETTEFLIPVLDCMYIRNAQLKNMRWNGRPQLYKNNVPLFDFIYHEYVVLVDGWQANAPQTVRWCAGIATVLGHATGPLFNGDPASRVYRDSKDSGALDILCHAKRAYTGYARQHVLFGRVLPPPGVEFPEMAQPVQSMLLFQQCSSPGGQAAKPASFVTPKVVQAAHLSPQGSVGLSFVNVSDEVVAFELNPSKYARYLKRPEADVVVRHNGKIVSQRKASLDGGDAVLKLTSEPRALVFVTFD